MNRTVTRSLPVLAAGLLLSATALAAEGGKPFARVGDWEIRKHPGYCTAKIGYDGDRALRISSSRAKSSYGFMGADTGAAGKGVPVTVWFDGQKKHRFTAMAVARADPKEDGGSPWLIVVEDTSEFSPTGFMLGRSVTFSYRVNGKAHEETYTFKDGNAAFAKLTACSGV